MAESTNCPKCGTYNQMHAKCDQCGAKTCLACYVKNAENQKCSSCGAMFTVKVLPQ
jgi:ribosomal protein L32